MEPYKKIEKAIIWLCKKDLDINNEYMKFKKDRGVVLGRSFSLGSEFQYELAKNLFEKTGLIVLVDYPISVPGRRQCIYPDVLIIDKEKIKGIIEIKMDCGWIKPENIKNMKKNYEQMKKNKEVSYKDKNTMEKKIITVPNRFRKIFVIVSEKNHHGDIKTIQKEVEKAGFKFVSLLKKSHYGDVKDKKDIKVIVSELKEGRKTINKLFDFGG